ncbi:hypothetical protein BDW22DRAFT_1357415 [Trametopsis cervina]|nr:hypothetical protein BDW22DRAFT_1357415 [Trametopsis cervina]
MWSQVALLAGLWVAFGAEAAYVGVRRRDGCNRDVGSTPYDTGQEDVCGLVAALSSSCAEDNACTLYDALLFQDSRGVPAEYASSCTCNTVIYSLVKACRASKLVAALPSWSAWSSNCSEVSIGHYPNPIPEGLSIPSWAFLDITSSPPNLPLPNPNDALHINIHRATTFEPTPTASPTITFESTSSPSRTVPNTTPPLFPTYSYPSYSYPYPYPTDPYSFSFPTYSYPTDPFSFPTYSFPTYSYPTDPYSFSIPSFSVPTYSYPTFNPSSGGGGGGGGGSDSSFALPKVRKTSVKTIVGAVVGSVSGFLTLLGGIWAWMKRRARRAAGLGAQQAQNTANAEQVPFMAQHPSTSGSSGGGSMPTMSHHPSFASVPSSPPPPQPQTQPRPYVPTEF